MRLTPGQGLLKEEDGYTLVETLVAMVLFMSVLIPLGMAIGTLLLDKEGEKINKALLLAEREMTFAACGRELGSTEIDAGGGFAVHREITPLAGGAREIRVSVAHSRKPAKVLVRLSKTVVQAP
jgi:hypothetical protein